MNKKQKRITKILIILLIIAIIIYSIAKKSKKKLGQGCASQGLETDANGNCIPRQLYYCTGVWDGIGASQPCQPCIEGVTNEGGASCMTLAECQASCIIPYNNGDGNNPMPENPNDMVDNTDIILPNSNNDGCINSRIGFSPSNQCVDNEPFIPPVKQIRGCTKPEAFNYNEFATIDDGSCRMGGMPDPKDPKDPFVPTMSDPDPFVPTMSDPLVPNNNGDFNPPPKPQQPSSDTDCYSGDSDCKKYLWKFMSTPRPQPEVPTTITTQTDTPAIDYGYKCVGSSDPRENCQPCTATDSNCMPYSKCVESCLNSPANPNWT